MTILIGEHEAHVWMLAVDRVAPRRPDWLGPEEAGRYRRLRREEARDLFLVARTHLRATLSRYAPLPPSGWRFVSALHGRPEPDPSVGARRLRFNLSRTRGLVGCVVTASVDCGIDVEHGASIATPAAVARQVLTEREQRDVDAHPERLLTYWTLKEAYLKGIGTGMHRHPRSVSIALDGGGAWVESAPDWRLLHSRPTADHHLALAVPHACTVKAIWA